MGRNTKGDRRERELVHDLDKLGFEVMRAPASGSATERDLPDVLAGNGKWVYAIEVKSSSGNPIYIDGSEILALERFADGFGATALIGVRFDRAEWVFYYPKQVYQTDGGNFRVKKSDAPDGIPIYALDNSDVYIGTYDRTEGGQS